MPVITTTKDTGGRGVLTAMTFVPPDAFMTPGELAAFAPGTGLNGQFLADLLSQFLAHEQCGVHLYRTVAGLTQNPVLQRRYEEFLAETEHHVDVLERLIAALGGDPGYVSPAARLTHAMDAKMLEAVALMAGSADILPLEMAMLEAVVLAETKDAADWKFLHALGEAMDEGEGRTAVLAAVAEVEPQEADHIGWAISMWQQMAMVQARSKTAMTLASLGEKLVGKVQDAIT
ncbi:MAG TPA: ferritin-like domain-containing protein [Acidimicrobiales bacterium]|jgi:rubrerythrin